MRRDDVAPGAVIRDALDAAVVLVLAALEVAAAQERVDGAAGAGEGEAEALADLLDRELAPQSARTWSVLMCDIERSSSSRSA